MQQPGILYPLPPIEDGGYNSMPRDSSLGAIIHCDENCRFQDATDKKWPENPLMASLCMLQARINFLNFPKRELKNCRSTD
jgi:hypothetical protein